MTAAKKHHDPKLDALHDRREKLGTKKRNLLAQVQRVDRRIATVEKRVKGVHKDRDHLRHSYDPMGFDGSPVSPVVFVVLTAARKRGVSFGVISGDRRDGVAQRFGHSSQDELYIHFIHGDPGYLPANPSNSSTHEYVNGGNGGTPAFPSVQFPVGGHLPPWALGLDLRSNAEATAFCAAVKAKLGIEFWQPYPTTSEAHHVDMRHDPMPRLVKLGIV
jgi:hypothetical protein